MGNKHSIASESKIENNVFTLYVMNCDNTNFFPENKAKNVAKYGDNKLTVTMEYNGARKSISTRFVKRAIWERGVFQFDLDSSFSKDFTLSLSTDASGLKWLDKPLSMDDLSENTIHQIVFRSNEIENELDGASASAPSADSVTLNIFYTTKLFDIYYDDSNNSNNNNTLDIDSKLLLNTRWTNSQKRSLIFRENIDQLEDGDLILYCGESGMSDLIRDRFYRPWSHVGIVVKAYPFHKKGEPRSTEKETYVLESVGKENIKDPFRTRQSLTGINLFKLSDRIVEYEGYCVQALRHPTPLSTEQRERLLTAAFEVHGSRAPFDVFQAGILMLERLNLWNIQSNYAVFCSELVAIMLFRCGLLPDELYKPANTDPGECSDFPCFGGVHNSPMFLKYDV
ncbi:hypothetical protein CYY_004870 [Polysphondylium violaceum]|uniref:Uncharacterized protein n=1 Tax=Polysphondylium violaceum TaxID=133409 RepID=A0A8J4PVS9_9MYCE|nr:hypothetical protein CYY_004870 [Polysphondylium violaceum]